jgi:hypothetical protein
MTATTERSVPTGLCDDGTHSLRYHISNSTTVGVQFCGVGSTVPANVSGFSFYMYVKPTSGTFTGITGELALLYDCSGAQMSQGMSVATTPNQWNYESVTFDDTSACGFGMNITSSTAWEADVYIDCVTFWP